MDNTNIKDISDCICCIECTGKLDITDLCELLLKYIKDQNLNDYSLVASYKKNTHSGSPYTCLSWTTENEVKQIAIFYNTCTKVWDINATDVLPLSLVKYLNDKEDDDSISISTILERKV